jgi:flagellar biosynthesis protein FliP
MKKFMRLISLVLTLSITLNFAFQNVAAVEVYEELASTFVDGVEYKYKVGLTGVTITKADGTAELTVDSAGNGTAKLLENGERKEYAVKINDLSENKVDVALTDIASGETTNFDDKQALVEEEYNGQAVVVLVPVAGLAILVLVLAGVIVYILGVLFVDLAVVLDKIRNDMTYEYFPAERVGDGVFIDPNAIDFNTAVNRMENLSGSSDHNSIYTFLSYKAFEVTSVVALRLGRGVKGPEIHHNNTNSVSYYHYHTDPSNKSHAWFSFPM